MSTPPFFEYRDGTLYCEGVAARDLAARFGTPLYVYSRAAFLAALEELQSVFAEFDPVICYSVKANSNLSVLKMLAAHGSGFDVVSSGELRRVEEAGGDPGRTVFAGVGKTDEEIAHALKSGVLMFNVESEAELDAIDRVSREHGLQAPVAPRVNPDVDPQTHRYISTGHKESKFGMDITRALRLTERARDMAGIKVVGLHMHIGSQITKTQPYADAAAKAADLVATMRGQGHAIQWLNLGGGFGIDYRGGEAQPITAYAAVMAPAIRASGCRLALEPGRRVAGNAGVLLSRVIFTKVSGDKRFLIQDAAMNDLLRPSLYQAFHKIWPVEASMQPPDIPAGHDGSQPGASDAWDVVGPVCESGDFLAKDRPLPPLERGDLLAVFSAGAYGMVMASNYNTRPRPAEVLVEGNHARLIRRRETYDDLVAAERDCQEGLGQGIATGGSSASANGSTGHVLASEPSRVPIAPN